MWKRRWLERGHQARARHYQHDRGGREPCARHRHFYLCEYRWRSRNTLSLTAAVSKTIANNFVQNNADIQTGSEYAQGFVFPVDQVDTAS